MFRDSNDRVLLQFGREVNVESAVHVEMLAFRDDLLVVAALRSALTHLFVFKLDSKSVVTDLSSTPWRFHMVLRECLRVFGPGISWSLSHIGRLGNEFMVVLAKLDSDGLNFIEFT